MPPMLLLVTPRPCTCKVILIQLTGSPHLVHLCFVSALMPCLRPVDVCLHLRNSLYNKWARSVTCEVPCGRKEGYNSTQDEAPPSLLARGYQFLSCSWGVGRDGMAPSRPHPFSLHSTSTPALPMTSR